MRRGIGIYIGRKEVTAASVSIEKNVTVIQQFAIEAIGPIAPSEVTKGKKSKNLTPEGWAIDRALQKISAKRASVTAAFNPFQLATRYFEMPLIPRREWDQAIPYEANRYLPFKVSETVSDFAASEGQNVKNERVLQVTISAAKIDILRSHLQDLRSASAKVKMIEPVFSAMARAISVGEQFDREKVYGFLFIDSDGSVNVTLSRGGIAYLSRDFLLSEDRVSNETRFFEELKASFDFMHSIAHTERIERVYLAGSGDLVFWSDFLKSVFGEIMSFELALFPTTKEISNETLAAILIPVGSALRGLKRKSPLGDLKLLPPQEKETKPERLKRLVGLEFLAVAAFFIVLRLIVLEPYAASLRSRSVKALGTEAARYTELANRSVEDLRSTYERLQTQATKLRQFSEGRILMSSKLKLLAKGMPSPIWLEQIEYRSGQAKRRAESEGRIGAKILTLQGQCYLANAEEDVKTINGWAEALSKDKAFLEKFSKVTVEEVRREKYLGRDTTMFRIEIS